MIGKAASDLQRALYLSPTVRRLWQRLELGTWEARGRPSRPPARFKHRLVKGYAERFGLDILVETGTFLGDTVFAALDTFRTIYSIELDRGLFGRARRRFAGYGHVHIVPGDSSEALPFVLAKLEQPALFWLDAHQMVGGVRGRLVTPIVQELEEILAGEIRDHVLLIDDARLFTGAGYPTIGQVRDRILEKHADWVFEVKDDVIRSHRPIGS